MLNVKLYQTQVEEMINITAQKTMNTLHGLHRLTLWSHGGFPNSNVYQVTVMVPTNGKLSCVLSNE